jgi:hypothetical protein
MAHGSKIISQIKLPNNEIYEIHDKHAVHTLADLAALGMDIEGIFVFKDTVATVADLPTSGNKIGDVYHVTANHSEYVWAKVDNGESEDWEEFGEHFVIDHIHDVTVTGANTASDVTGTASIPNAPKVEASPIYAKVSTDDDDFVKSYPGVTSKMVTTSINPAGSATSVISSVTPSTGSVTGVSGSVTASKATAGTAVNVAKVGSEVTVATGLTGGSVTAGSKGKEAEWSAKVTNGVLEFVFKTNTPTTPTSVTLPTASTTKITPAAANGTITPYTFADVTVPVANKEATEFVTGVSTSSASVATVGSAVTVATGTLDSNASGASVMTGLGTASTAPALVSATLATGTVSDGIHTGDDVTVSTQELSGSISGTAVAQVWQQNVG